MEVNLAELPVAGSMVFQSPAGTPLQYWLEKWSEWEIQVVVTASFGLQIILFFFAGIRRHSVSSVLKVFLWLVYLIADAAAIYALGHMSASLSKTSTDKHQLLAFWALFLLLHLGGQDTITAYALEDNELWVRHLLNMFLQVAGTGYVLHKYIIAHGATIVYVAVLVAVAGGVKYGERIWALKCANKGSNWAYWHSGVCPAENCFTRNENFRNYEFTVRTSHYYFYCFVTPLIMDRREKSKNEVEIENLISEVLHHVDGKLEGGDVSAWERMYREELYKAIEVQLALTYDSLYTKAQVVHTWYGYLIRVISFGFCFIALGAFARSKRDGYCTPDIVITFVLLAGACALEVSSAFKVIGSTWTYDMLRRCRWDWLATAILFARYHLIVVKDGRWSNLVGQYSFISFCSTDWSGIIKRRIAGWIGLEDWFNKSHYIKHAELSPALKEFVWRLIRGEKSGMVQVEDEATGRGSWARRLSGFDQSEELDVSMRLEFHKCVVGWHIATSTFLSDPAVRSELVDNGMAEAEVVNTLSDYMMYLLVQHPDIRVKNAADIRRLFVETSTCLDREVMMLGYPGTLHQIIRYFRTKPDYDSWDQYPGEAVLMNAGIVVRTLVSMKLNLKHKMVIIARMWTEILSYAATNASGDFHARQLSNGGEFLTHILLLTKYCSNRYERDCSDFRNRAGSGQYLMVPVPVEPTEDVGGHVERMWTLIARTRSLNVWLIDRAW